MLHLAVPFLCALAFPAGAYLLKRAMESGRDTWGVMILSNLATSLVFLPALILHPGVPSATGLLQAFACGLFFFLGQVAAYRSFATGDLSVAVPAQGTKVLWVALFAWIFLDQPAGWKIWIAAALAPVAFYFLREHAPGKSGTRKMVATLIAATLAALFLAALDTAIQAWSPAWNPWVFGFWIFLFQGVLSAALWVFPAGRKMFAYSGDTWAAALGGSAILAGVSLGMVWAIAVSGEAAWVNVLFNSRVLWSVLFVWALGRVLRLRETSGSGSRRILASRLAGAALMMIAIVIVLV